MTSRLRALPLLAALLLASGCAPDEPWDPPDGLYTEVGGIIGGLPTQGWPAVGAYLIDGGNGGMCSATLVSPEVLLTACHCVDSSGPQDMFYVGSNLGNATMGDMYGILQSIPHPSCNLNSQHPHDVAVLILNQPIEFMDPIPVNTTPFDNSWIGKWLHYVGFGSDTYYGGPGAGLKRETDIEIYEYYSLEYIHWSDGTNTCSGDSGGPGLVDIDGNWYVAGVNSSVFSQSGDACSGGGFEMRVDAELNFLDDYFDPSETPYDDDASDDDGGDDDGGDDDTVDFANLPAPRIEDDYDPSDGCGSCSSASATTNAAASIGVLLTLSLLASRRRR